VGQKLGSDTAGPAATNWPERYSMPWSAMLSNKAAGGGGTGGLFQVATAQRLAGHGSACGRC